jgi:hypothetical protein
MSEVCCLCSQPSDKPERITLSEDEKAAIRRGGAEAKDEYVYCHLCWALLHNKEHAARLFQGLARARARQFGHPNPDEAGSRVYEYLMSKRRSTV